MPSLEMLAPGVYAWIADDPRLGWANAGCVIDADGVTVIDALCTPAQAVPFATAVADLGHPVRRLVLTSSHIEFVGGSSLFRLAAVYGSAMTSRLLDQPADPAVYRRFLPELAGELGEVDTRPVSHVVAEPVMLTPAVQVVPVPGHTPGDLAVRVPAAGVTFAGGTCAFGVTPLGFQADFPAWLAALDALAGLGDLIVPGHGRPGGTDELAALRAYLVACMEADGDPARIPPGPWDSWADRDLDEINVERAARQAAGDESPPVSMLRRMGLA